MREMKDSGIEWIGKIPKEWELLKLKYLVDDTKDTAFLDGDWIESPYITDEGIPYFTTGNIGDGYFKVSDNGYITDDTFRILNCKYAHPNDLVISRLNEPYGRSCILPADLENCVLAVDIVILRPKKDINKQFICYITQCSGYQDSVLDYARGTTMKRISRTNLGNIKIPIPPRDVQQSIVDFLDDRCADIDALTSDIESQIDMLEQYKRSVITEAVTKGLNPDAEMKDSGVEWIGSINKDVKLTPLKYLLVAGTASIKVGPFGSQLSGSDFVDEETEYWVYNQRTVLDENYNTGNAFITQEKYDSMEGFHVHTDDILLTTRGSIGKLSRVPENHKKGVLHPCIIRFRIDDSLFDYDLLRLIFNCSDFVSRQLNYKSNATTIDVIYSETLKNIILPVWSMPEQEQIAKYLDDKCSDIDAIIADKQAQLDILAEYKKSLIYEYVTGKKDTSIG